MIPMKHPNLIIPGFPKSGTTSLHNILCQHKDITGIPRKGGSSFIKEPHTYTFDRRYAKRSPVACSEKYLIDASTTYLISKTAIDRILLDTPDAKFIVIMRDPIDRVKSHYNWYATRNVKVKKWSREFYSPLSTPFDPDEHINGAYKRFVQFSQYSRLLSQMLEKVNAKNVLYLYFLDLQDRPDYIAEAVRKFLGIEAFEGLSSPQLNPSRQRSYVKQVSPLSILPEPVKQILRPIINPFRKRKTKHFPKGEHWEREVFNALYEDIKAYDNVGVDLDRFEVVSRLLKSQ